MEKENPAGKDDFTLTFVQVQQKLFRWVSPLSFQCDAKGAGFFICGKISLLRFFFSLNVP